MYRLRIKYTKVGILKFLSHLEVSRALERALRRAQLPLVFSQGFSPHPRISHGPALSVGIASRGEYIDVLLEKRIEEKQVLAALNEVLPQGLKVLEAKYFPTDAPSIASQANMSMYRVEAKLLQPPKNLNQQVKKFLDQSSIIIRRKKNGKEISFEARPSIEEFEIIPVKSRSFIFNLTLRNISGRSIKPDEVMKLFAEFCNCQVEIEAIERLGIFWEKEGKKWISVKERV